MADATNAESPAAGGQLSGEASRDAAIRRLAKLQQSAGRQKKEPHAGGGMPPVASYGGPPAMKG